LWHGLLRDSRFFVLLLNFDRDLAEEVRSRGCPHCGAALHWGRYVRKPRGAPAGLPPDYDLRESLCCSAEGCRKRVLPPSLRFFGRRVYLGPVFVLVSAMIGGISERRTAALREVVGVSTRTLGRWRRWWRGEFPQSDFWQSRRARFARPVDVSCLPQSLLERFGRAGSRRCAFAALRFLAPVTVTAGSSLLMEP
jgi:hypothetical protein